MNVTMPCIDARIMSQNNRRKNRNAKIYRIRIHAKGERIGSRWVVPDPG